MDSIVENLVEAIHACDETEQSLKKNISVMNKIVEEKVVETIIPGENKKKTGQSRNRLISS